MLSWIMDYPETAVSVVVTLFCLVRVAWLKRDFFSPISVYCFTQFLTLGIAFLRLDPAMTDFHAKTWMIWILGLVSFCAGCFLVTQYARSKRINCDPVAPTPPQDYNWNIHLRHTMPGPSWGSCSTWRKWNSGSHVHRLPQERISIRQLRSPSGNSL